MKKNIFILLVFFIGGYLILTNIRFKQSFEFDSDCISFEIGSFDYDLVKVKIEGKIRKKLFEDKGDVSLRIQVGDVTYPIRTEFIESVPVYYYMTLNSYDYDKFIMIPMNNFYWNHKINTVVNKFHGVLYIDIEKEFVLIAPSIDSRYPEKWSFDEGYPVIISGSDILNAVTKIDNAFGWHLDDWIEYYGEAQQN